MAAAKLRRSPASEQDLRDIWRHFAEIASVEVAGNLLREIARAADRIADHPLAWRERGDLVPGVRSVPIHPYSIFYRLQDDVVEIVRVLHERRDTDRALRRRR